MSNPAIIVEDPVTGLLRVMCKGTEIASFAYVSNAQYTCDALNSLFSPEREDRA